MSEGTTLSLPAIVEAAARSLEGVTSAVDGATTTLQRGDRPFAILLEGTLSVHLGRELAGAAVRTPDAAAGTDGEGWVDFRPSVLDQYAADRAASWIEAAWRRAG